MSVAVPAYSLKRETNMTIMHKYEINQALQALCGCYDERFRRQTRSILPQRQSSHRKDASAIVSIALPFHVSQADRQISSCRHRLSHTHVHRNGWWDTFSALKVFQGDCNHLSGKRHQALTKPSRETAEQVGTVFKMLIKGAVTQMLTMFDLMRLLWLL